MAGVRACCTTVCSWCVGQAHRREQRYCRCEPSSGLNSASQRGICGLCGAGQCCPMMAPISRAPFMSWRFCCVHVGTGAMAPPGAAHNKGPRCRGCFLSTQAAACLRGGCPTDWLCSLVQPRRRGGSEPARSTAQTAPAHPCVTTDSCTRALPQTSVPIQDCRQACPCSIAEQPARTREVDAQVAIRSWPPAGPGVLLPRLHLAPGRQGEAGKLSQQQVEHGR